MGNTQQRQEIENPLFQQESESNQPEIILVGEKKGRFQIFERLRKNRLLCVMKIQCFSKLNLKKSQWKQQCKYLLENIYRQETWQKTVLELIESNEQEQIQLINTRYIHRIAEQSLLGSEEEEKSLMNISIEELSQRTQEIIEKSWILPEQIDEYRNQSENNPIQIGKRKQKNHGISSEEIFEKTLWMHKIASTYFTIFDSIQEQIRDVLHPIYHILGAFYLQFKLKYSVPQIQPQIVQQMQKDVKQFESFLVDVIRFYYQIDDLCIYLGKEVEAVEGLFQVFFNIDNLRNFSNQILFDKSEFYMIILNQFKLLESQTQERYQFNLKYLDRSAPADFRVDKQLQLSWRDNEMVQENLDRKSYVPYQSSILKLRELDSTKAPIEKMKIIVQVCELLNSSIREYYDLKNLKNLEQMNYDAENLLSIFIYIVSRAQIKSLLVHQMITEKFLELQNSQCVSGYLLITVLGSVHYIANQSSPRFSMEIESSRKPDTSSKQDAKELDDFRPSNNSHSSIQEPQKQQYDNFTQESIRQSISKDVELDSLTNSINTITTTTIN